MITIYSPLRRSFFQPVNFGTINYNFPSSITSTNIDEVIISNVGETDNSQIDFIKRYNTWFVFTSMVGFSLVPYKLTLVYYDRINRIAYTAEDTLKVLRKA